MRKISEQTVGRTGVVMGLTSRIRGLAGVLGGIGLFLLLPNPLPAAQRVTLAWSPSADASVTGYHLYYGAASRTYTGMSDAGGGLTVTVSNLVEGTTYYFAATAYNLLGMESLYSNEISYTVPAVLASLRIRAASARQIVLTVTGPVGRTNEILATPDLKIWTVIGTVAVGAGGSASFTDTNAAGFPRRFYRTREKP